MIGLLTYPGSPLLYPTAVELQKLGHSDIVVISDGDEVNQKFVSIISARTEGKAVFHTFSDFEKLHIPFYFVKNHNSEDCIDLIHSLSISILGSCGTPRKLGTDMLKSVALGVVNCHPGKLPEYRGSSSVEWALTNGHPVYSTAHFMTEEYDAGPIISDMMLSIKGLTYPEIRLQMISQQSKHLAHAIHQVLKASKPPEDYAAQPHGKTWGVFPEERTSELLNRRF